MALLTPSESVALQAGHAQPSVVSHDSDGRPVIRGVRLSQPLRVDGVLDEEVYRTTMPIDEFIQLVPRIGERVSERTEAWVTFDREYIYVSARCWNSAPSSEWIADEMHHDSNRLTEGEMFGVLFDTFHDRRSF